MFSGIIEEKGKINKIDGKIFEIESSFIKELSLGQSISHDGVCLTITNILENTYQVEVMPETLKKSNLGKKNPGDFINLERSLKMGDRLDGHLVQGHVDTIGTLDHIELEENSRLLTISFPANYSKYFVEKGSVSLNGISLTIIKANKDNLIVGIIPFTWEKTNLSNLKIGDKINIETDILAKYFIKNMITNKGK